MSSLNASAPRRLAAWLGVPTLVLGLPLALVLVRLLPAEGLGLGARLVLAAACVLLVPGAVALGALGWRPVPAVAVAAALALSLAVCFGAFALTFALDGTLRTTLWATALFTAAAAVVAALALRRRSTSWAAGAERADRVAVGFVLAAGIAFALLVWWTRVGIETGDALFHLARARRLAETDVLTSVAVANEFRDGGLHPGYAFPLWHGALALVAELAGVDVSLAVLHLSAVLTPVAFVVAYAAGRALFGTWAGGAAVLAAHVALLAFSRPGSGMFETLSLPASATRILLAPALLALAFAYLREPSRRALVPIAAASLAVVVVHPSYLVLLAIPVVGFIVLALALEPARRRLAAALAAVTAAVVVPAGLFLAWLYPVIAEQDAHRSDAEVTARAIRRYGEQLQPAGEGFRMAPDYVTRGGPIVVAAFVAVPLAALAVRRRWGAFAAGGMLATLAVLLVPAVFTAVAEIGSVSQARRLLAFLPIPFAVAAGAVLAGRVRGAGVAAALVAGIVLQVLYGGTVSEEGAEPGPLWPLWVAGVGGALGLVAGAIAGRRLVDRLAPDRWTAFAALALVLPVAIGSPGTFERTAVEDPYALAPGLVEELRELDREDVVFASASVSHRVGAAAPVYLAVTIPHHAADTATNEPYRRQRDSIRFFAPRGATAAGRRAMLREYGADYLLVDKSELYPRRFVESLPRVYEDGRYLLLRVNGT